MNKLSLFIILFVLSAQFSFAQVPTSGNIFVGYSYQDAGSTSFGFTGVDRVSMNGWRASLEGKVFPLVGIVADFTGEYGTQHLTEFVPGPIGGPVTLPIHGHEFDVMFGPRLAVPVGDFHPFGEVMIGISHMKSTFPDSSLSDTSLGTALGGGIDYSLFDVLAWRVEADYVRTRFFHTHQSDARISTGIVFRF